MSDTTVVERPAPARPAWDDETLVAKYIALRDKKAEIKKRHTDELAPVNAAMDTMEAWLLEDLNKLKADSIKTKSGTFYKTTRTSVTCNAWSRTLEWIQSNERWELLEARVNKTMASEALKELAEAAVAKQKRGEPVDPSEFEIPGVVVSSEIEVNVRRT